MNLSNRLTFSIFCIFLLVGFAALPVIAQVTIEAEWKADLDDDPTTTASGQGAGWSITIGGLSDHGDPAVANDNPTVTYLDPDGIAAAATNTTLGFAAVADDATTSTGTIDAVIGDEIAVQVVVAGGDPTVTTIYQRVTFPAAGPSATPVSMTLLRLPKLMKLAKSQYYAGFGDTVDVTFDFAPAVANTNDAPMAPLHISDVEDPTDAFDQTGWQVVGVSGTNRVMIRTNLELNATSVEITAGLSTNYAQIAGDGVAPNPSESDGHAMIHYDVTAPTVTNIPGTNVPTIMAPTGFPAPPDGAWDSTFILTFSISDDTAGSGLLDADPVRIDTDRDKLDVGPVGLGIQDTTTTDTEYLVRITPKEGRATTAGEEVVITIVPIDKAGNEGSSSIIVKLAESTPPLPPPAVYMSAAPASGNVMRGDTITVTFDKAPENLVATNAALSGNGATRTLTIDAAQAAGALEIVLTWGDDSRQVLNYTVVVPPAAAVAFSSAVPASGATVMPSAEITLTFAANPGDVTANVGAITGTGATRTLTIPAGQAAGEVTITVSWTMVGHVDGSKDLTYTVEVPDAAAVAFSSADPADTATVIPGAEITLTFAANPGDVTASVGEITGTGTTRTLTIPADQAEGAVAITVSWTKSGHVDGFHDLTYTVDIPDAAVAFSSADPADGADVMASETITLTFAANPGDVTASVGEITGTGTTRTLTIPAGQAAGEVTITVSWTMAGHEDGSTDLTYTVFASTNPDSPSNIMMVEIPANSYIVLVRAMSANEGALKFPNVPPVGGTAVDVRVWGDMPDLHDLFLRSTQNRGGALVLRKSEDARDKTGTYADPDVGTVGISEIMWARDLGKANAADAAAGQWIELQNLNDKPVKVLIYAQKGRDGLISGGQLVNTAAGDSLLGSPGGMVIDAIQNIRNDGNQNNGGWDVKGTEGNSVTGDPFASMHRILPHNKPDYRNATGSRYNNRKGTKDSHWAVSGAAYVRGQTSHVPPILFDYRGSPGDVNARTSISILTPAGRTGVSHAITINEVGNRGNDSYDWIELKGDAGTNLRNYMISIVTSNSSDVPLVQFPANDNAKIADSGVFLILASDPANDDNHPIAPGRNVNVGEADHQQYHWNSPVRYLVQNFNLPNDGKFVLILRSPDNHEGQRSGADGGKGVAETGTNDLNRIVDVAGNDDNLAKSNYPNAVSSTGVWPLRAFRSITGFTNNSFAQDTVHQRNRVTTNDGASGVGAQDNNNGKTAFGDRGWTGVGYRRIITGGNQHGGTPGYPNGALQNRGGGIVGSVYISEIMYADGSNGTLPQWIELRNTSKTTAADLHNWRLTITNHDTIDADGTLWDGKASASVLLNGMKIKPNSAVLITSRTVSSRSEETYLPNADIFSLYPSHRGTFGMTSPGDDVINVYGFKITLHTRGNEGSQHWELVDEVTNLDTDASDRRGSRERYDPPRWAWPDGMTADGARVSVARANEPGGTETTGFVIASGTVATGWILSSMDGRTDSIDYVYYGDKDDISSPGQTVRSPLPVSLSFFRPTLEEGQIVIRWTTESELDNAGFNILRSDTKDGEFTQVNEQIIQGNGTTGERSTYKWVDTTAKPDAVYYYQIEDVSFAGERQTLATTKLKGLVSAKNKLTTTWGDLKSQN